MATAKCSKCGGSAIANTFQQARKLINHAVGLSRGIKCGDTYNMVQEIGKKITAPAKVVTPKVVTSTEKKTTSEKSKTKKSSNSI